MLERALTNEQEIGAQIIGAPDVAPFYLRQLGISGEMLVYVGQSVTGEHVRFVQHYQQAGVLLTPLPKRSGEPRRLGFDTGDGPES